MPREFSKCIQVFLENYSKYPNADEASENRVRAGHGNLVSVEN